jgi:alpha-beta hydrolase superfamily lysophospholipase
MTRHVRPALVAGGEAGDTLVIALHGCTWTPRRRRAQLRDVVAAVRQRIPGADVFAPLMPIEFWSLQTPDRIIDELLAEVDAIWEERTRTGTGYLRVVMIGFSFGSVLLRRLFCRAAGALDSGAIDAHAARPWAARVERMILLAGLNRGWTVDSPVTRLESFANSIGTAIGHVLPRKPTLFAIRRGAPFLTQTRLQWLALEQSSRTPPVTVQLLGTRDDIVSPADNIDLATGGTFVYLEVPDSGHFDVIRMGADTPTTQRRQELFHLALAGSPAELASQAVSGSDLLQLLPVGADATGHLARRTDGGRPLDDVVFVVHGIRDKGYWTRKIARVIVETGQRQGTHVVAVAPTYGYFAMLPFLLPWTRRAKVEWLLDMYVTIRCCYPEARVSFVGHSNGTYILAGAVQSCPAVQFKNVVFAGSVVRSTFEWSRYLANNQVGRVLNYVASADWVVAIFPRLLQILRLQDLGGAGFDGFVNAPSTVSAAARIDPERILEGQRVQDVEYVSGRHSAALDEGHWQDIARFVFDGDAPPHQVTTRSPLVVAAAHGAVLFWLLIAMFVATPLYLILLALGFPEVTGGEAFQAWQVRAAATLPPWLSAAALMGWTRLVATILTRL